MKPDLIIAYMALPSLGATLPRSQTSAAAPYTSFVTLDLEPQRGATVDSSKTAVEDQTYQLTVRFKGGDQWAGMEFGRQANDRKDVVQNVWMSVLGHNIDDAVCNVFGAGGKRLGRVRMRKSLPLNPPAAVTFAECYATRMRDSTTMESE